MPFGASFNPSTQSFSWLPSYTQAGTYPGINFEVSDGEFTDSEDITITVNNVNQSPVADAGANQTVLVNEVVSFDGSGSSDPDGSITSYSWNFGDGGSDLGVTTTHSYATAGTYTVTLAVTDNEGASSQDTAIITVNSSDTINAPTGLSATVSGATVTLRWIDNSNNEEGFYLERGRRRKGRISYSRVGQVAQNVTTYSEDVSNGTYYYRVQAYNLTTGRVSGYSNELKVDVGKGGKGSRKKPAKK